MGRCRQRRGSVRRRPFGTEQRRYPGGQGLDRPLVGLRDPGAVDAESGRPPATVPEATGNGPDIDSSGDELCGGEVPQLVDVHLPAEPLAHAAVSLSHGVGLDRSAAVDIGTEDERVVIQRGLGQCAKLSTLMHIGAQERHGLRVEHDPSALVGFCVLLPHLGAELTDARADVDDRCREIDVPPAQSTQLTAACAGSHRKPHEHAPAGLGPSGGNDLRGLFGTGWLRVGSCRGRRFRLLYRVAPDPTPPHGASEGAVEKVVTLPDRGVAHRATSMRPAPLIADVVALSSILIKRLHDLTPPEDLKQPPLRPVGSTSDPLPDIPGLSDADEQYLHHRIERAQDEFPSLRFVLPPGVIHVDADVGNVLVDTAGQAVVIDLDSLSEIVVAPSATATAISTTPAPDHGGHEAYATRSARWTARPSASFDRRRQRPTATRHATPHPRRRPLR